MVCIKYLTFFYLYIFLKPETILGSCFLKKIDILAKNNTVTHIKIINKHSQLFLNMFKMFVIEFLKDLI